MKKYYVGFCDGKVHIDPFKDKEGQFYGVIYTNRKIAKKLYPDVREVKLVYLRADEQEG